MTQTKVGTTMTIRVLYFASLRELFGREEETLKCGGIHTVEDVWKKVSEGYEVGASILNSVNQEYAELDTPVKSGDEVAFFPPVTGG